MTRYPDGRVCLPTTILTWVTEHPVELKGALENQSASGLTLTTRKMHNYYERMVKTSFIHIASD